MNHLHLSVQLHLNGPMWWAVCAAAVFRLTRLVTSDAITERFRRWAVRRQGDHKRLAYFLTCPWCVGFWMAVAVAALVTLWPTGAAYIVLVLSWSTVTGLLAERMD